MKDNFPSQKTGDQLDAVFQSYVVHPLTDALTDELKKLHNKLADDPSASMESRLLDKGDEIQADLRKLKELPTQLTATNESIETLMFSLLGIRTDIAKEATQTRDALLEKLNETTSGQQEKLEEAAAHMQAAVEANTKQSQEQHTTLVAQTQEAAQSNKEAILENLDTLSTAVNDRLEQQQTALLSALEAQNQQLQKQLNTLTEANQSTQHKLKKLVGAAVVLSSFALAGTIAVILLMVL